MMTMRFGLSCGRLHAAILFSVAVVFGGGGSSMGLFNLAVQLTALIILAWHPWEVLKFFRDAPRLPAILIGAALALPLLQSMPLPPSVWQFLPGRDTAIETYRFMGQPDAWMPMSQEVRRTLIAFLSLIPPFALLVLTWDLPDHHKRQSLLLLIGAGVFTVILGAIQLASGNRAFMLFGGYAQSRYLGSQYLLGTFQNHSTTGIIMVLALCGLIGVMPIRLNVRWKVGVTLCALALLVGIVLTGSRSAMAATVVPATLVLMRFARSGTSILPSFRNGLIGLGMLAAFSGGLAYLANHNERVRSSVVRFSHLQDDRLLIWSDMKGAISRFWPVGSGIGTLDEVFQLDESLENLAPGRAARAHNEYLEILLESGLLGLLMLGASLGFLGVRCFQSIRSAAPELAAGAGLIALAAQSFSDFPLRTEAALCAASILIAFLIKAPLRQQERESRVTKIRIFPENRWRS